MAYDWTNRLTVLCMALSILLSGLAHGADKGDPSKLELDGAEHRLKKLEERVRRMRGQPFKLGYEGTQALKRVGDLYKKYPDHPAVKDMFKRARTALLASKGETTKIKEHMLVYRENKDRLRKAFHKVAQKEWQAFRLEALAEKGAIVKPFPPASHRNVDIVDMTGRYVFLEGFDYPRNEFRDTGRQFCFVGAPSRGYYYVQLNNRAWLGAYEAVKRYRRLINPDVPEDMEWTLVGQITGLELLVPQAGEKKTMRAHWGWVVVPVGIWVPERTFAIADASLELGGRFAGEDKMEEIKQPWYSVRKIPDDVTPEELVRIYITAIKELNYDLYLECIDPRRRVTRRALDRCMYHWEWHQHRFAKFYVHAEVGEAKVHVIGGYDANDRLEQVFLTKEERDRLREISGPLIEEASLTTQAFTERGLQYGSPKPRRLRRVAKGRWYITNYDQPF